jgi:hypothetical protein
MKKYILFILLISSCVVNHSKKAQQTHKLFVSLYMDGTKIPIDSSNTKFILTNKYNKIIGKLKGNFLIFPSITTKDSIFKFIVENEHYHISFDSIYTSMIYADQDMEWKIGIDHYPFHDDDCYLEDKTIKSVKYLIFDLYEKGDGIVIVNEYK